LDKTLENFRKSKKGLDFLKEINSIRDLIKRFDSKFKLISSMTNFYLRFLFYTFNCLILKTFDELTNT